MQTKMKKQMIVTASLFLAFLLFTVLMKTVDVRAIGPEGSTVGLAAINQFVFERFGVHLLWYHITDWLGVAAVATAFGFAAAGLFQLIARKSIRKVDPGILLLGAFYLLVIAVYLFFELVVINYRPILLSHRLEASFPSSHVMIVICIMVTAQLQLHRASSEKSVWLWAADLFSVFLIAATVIGRLLSGVHWFTDIAAGILLSSALISLYRCGLSLISGARRRG